MEHRRKIHRARWNGPLNPGKSGVAALFIFLLSGISCPAESAPPIASAISNIQKLSIEGDDSLAKKIRAARPLLKDPKSRTRALETLGWLFIEKARLDGNQAAFLPLAASCACALEASDTKRELAALLMKGHIAHQKHEFEKARTIALQLVAKRGNPFDYALLGDAFFDTGKINEAAAAYQKMIDLRPGLPSYLRAAEIRFIKGDVEGCLEVMLLAVKAGSPREPESLAWAWSRFSHFLLSAGRVDDALAAAKRSLDLIPEYAPGLAAEGQALMSRGEFKKALVALSRSAEQRPHPLHQWPLWECLRALGKHEEAKALRRRIVFRGRRADPRTLALFLATDGRETELAISLSRSELTEREDIFSYDALAWSLYQKARSGGGKEVALESRGAMKKALAEGTRHARLHLHAGLIAVLAGEISEAKTYLDRATEQRASLLPSELALLTKAVANEKARASANRHATIQSTASSRP